MKNRKELEILKENNLGLNNKYRRYPIEDIENIKRIVRKAQNKDEVLKFFYFWGVGFKATIDNYDKKAISYLKSVVNIIEKTTDTEGDLHLLFSDLHGISNNFSKSHIMSYYASVQNLAQQNQIKTTFLSDLYTPEEINALFDEPNKKELLLFEEKQQDLQIGALKTGSLETIQSRALRYMLVRLREQKRIKEYFSQHILLCGDKRDNHYLFPNLPKICIFNLAPKIGHKAWFISENSSIKL